MRRQLVAASLSFLYSAFGAPHTSDIGLHHEHLFAAAKFPRPPSFNKVDVSDKPFYVRKHPRFTASEIDHMEEELYQQRFQSLQAIDDLVERLVQSLKKTRQIKDTFIFYSSDHEFRVGEHRLRPGRGTAYAEDIWIPLVVRDPEMLADKRIRPMGLNIDLAPTFADIANLEPSAFLDGRSYLPLLKDPDRPQRRLFRIGRLELGSFESKEHAEFIRFEGIRTRRWSYIEYSGSQDRELYDLKRDPDQL